MKSAFLILVLSSLGCSGALRASSGPVPIAVSPGIVLSSNGPATAGTSWTVKVTPTAGETLISAAVTVGGQRVTPTVTPMPDGTWEVVVPLPGSAAGDTVRLTILSGGAVKRLTGVVATQP